MCIKTISPIAPLENGNSEYLIVYFVFILFLIKLSILAAAFSESLTKASIENCISLKAPLAMVPFFNVSLAMVSLANDFIADDATNKPAAFNMY